MATLTVGLLLIFLELNRPGRVFAGSLGVLLVLLAAAALTGMSRPAWVPLLLLCVVGSFLLNLYRKLPAWWLLLATLGSIFALQSFRSFSSSGTKRGVHTAVSVVCGAVLGIASAALTRIAHRARRAKALN